MSYLQQLISNSVLITALIGWFAAQVLKMILVWDKKKFDFKRIIGSGGMPSSHSSFVMALTMSIGFTQGFDSVAFAISEFGWCLVGLRFYSISEMYTERLSEKV